MAAPALDLPDLTVPAGEPHTLRRVLSLYLHATLRDFLRLPLAAVATGNRALFQQTVKLLELAGPRAALRAVRPVTVSVLLKTLQKELGPGGDAVVRNRLLREACALLLLELAGQGALPPEGVLLGRDAAGVLPVLRSPGLKLLLEPLAGLKRLRLLPGHIELHGAAMWPIPLADLTFQLDDAAPAHLTRPYLEIVPGLHLALADNNPLSEFEAHPDKQGNTLDLGDKPAAAWLDPLREAIRLIDEHLPHLGQELRLTVQLLVPVGYEPERHLSASYQEAVGLLYLTLHPNAMTMTEAVIHEFQHNKLNAAFGLDPLIVNAFSPLYASPVRPDPRPLHGVVLAVHAFQPVARLYEAMCAAGHPLSRNPAWLQRFADVVRLNHEGATTVLNHAEPTPSGVGLLAEMRALDAHFQNKPPPLPNVAPGGTVFDAGATGR